jgi:hypothetical protein
MTDTMAYTPAQAVALMADRVRHLADHPPADELLQRALELAIETVPGCEEAGISVMVHRRIETPASVGALAAACDTLQEELGSGPCIDALAHADLVRVDDMTADDRWPGFAERAARLGVHSLLAVRMATPRDRLAALNLYATVPGAFDRDSELLATAYATHVGMLLAAQDKEANLRAAIRSRESIGQAMGILMERHRITASQAFDLIVHASQSTNIKLRDIAEELVRTGALPGR